ncbi:uncharacterized protein A4U43_C08F2470 [Asparagus officinalis]|nr:uncharacterized protein A4U43_C08F2470 [Asparagus officinalis]
MLRGRRSARIGPNRSTVSHLQGVLPRPGPRSRRALKPGIPRAGSQRAGLLRDEAGSMSVVLFSRPEEGSPVSSLLETGRLRAKNVLQSEVRLREVPIRSTIWSRPSARCPPSRRPTSSWTLRRGDGQDTEATHLPFPMRDGNLYAIQYRSRVTDGGDSARGGVSRVLRRFYARMGRFVSSGARAAYVNYLDLDLGTVAVDGDGRWRRVSSGRGRGGRGTSWEL